MTSHEVSAMLDDLGLSPDLRAALERLLALTLEIERRERKACACEICIDREQQT